MNQLSAVTEPLRSKTFPARDAVLELKSRIGKSVLGRDHLVESMLIGLLANGNMLIESRPGLAKTRAVPSPISTNSLARRAAR
jgi:MoxR-like ATPase